MATALDPRPPAAHGLAQGALRSDGWPLCNHRLGLGGRSTQTLDGGSDLRGDGRSDLHAEPLPLGRLAPARLDPAHALRCGSRVVRGPPTLELGARAGGRSGRLLLEDWLVFPSTRVAQATDEERSPGRSSGHVPALGAAGGETGHRVLASATHSRWAGLHADGGASSISVATAAAGAGATWASWSMSTTPAAAGRKATRRAP